MEMDMEMDMDKKRTGRGTKSRKRDGRHGRKTKTAATYSPTLRAVPSARPGLTSLFGMGRGGTPAL